VPYAYSHIETGEQKLPFGWPSCCLLTTSALDGDHVAIG